MNEDYYISLIIKSLSNEIEKEEETELNTWINASSENEQLYIQHKKIWDASSSNTDFEPDVERAFEKFNAVLDESTKAKIVQIKSSSTKKWYKIAGIAASILFVICSYLFYQHQSLNTKDNIFISKEITTKKTLPDGSLFWLHKGSKIAYNSKFKIREIELEGEGYFEIKKDPDHPFEIHCKEALIKVIGTAFNVKAYPEDSTITVTVESGKVSFHSKKTDTKVFLTKGQKGIINTVTGEITVENDPVLNTLSWKEDRLIFENATLKEIAAAIENHFRIKVEISPAIVDCHYSFELYNPKLDEIIELFSNYYSVRNLENGKLIQITGNSCE